MPASASTEMIFKVTGSPEADKLQVRRAVVEEGLSMLTEVRFEVLSRDRALDLGKMIGKPFNLVSNSEALPDRKFLGMCISAENIGVHNGAGRYIIETRPRHWYLTLSINCRVFQNKSTPEIIQSILGDYGFASNLTPRLSRSYEKREFCLQYDETDFAFISRLMEEEGIYYYFDHKGSTEYMVLADGIGGHDPMPGGKLEYIEEAAGQRLQGEGVYGVEVLETTPSGKVSLADQNFELSAPKLSTTRNGPSGSHPHNKYELYRHPGRFRTQSLGQTRAQVKMESAAAAHRRFIFSGPMLALGTGMTLTVKNQPRTMKVSDYLAVRATHWLRSDPDETADDGPDTPVPMPRDLRGNHHCRCETIEKDVPYRAPLTTPWPSISSIQTAFVVGPAGEEIYTDKYGRIRIQFIWDRLQGADEKASVWVRVAMPWAGKNWGVMAIPRIGEEVVVQFENGDPDRPIVTGMLYNSQSMPPWTLPDNMTQSGIKTNSSKGGGGYNELMLEDKKGKELVRFQAEKDYEQIVKNNATIKVGADKKDPGDMTLTVQNHLTETVTAGDHTFKVEAGQQTLFVKKDKTETIEGNCTTTVTQDVTHTVKQGNVSETVQMGNFSLKTSLGKVEIEAMQEILLTVGSSSVKIDQMGVTIKGGIIKIEGMGMLEAKAPMTQVKGDAILILKGGMTMIN